MALSSGSSIALTIVILVLSQTHLSQPFRPMNIHLSMFTDDPNPVSDDVHDILPKYGFPKGLLPNNIKSYSLGEDGSFEVELTSECYVHYPDQLVYYEPTIRGKLSYGQVTGVDGIMAKKLFFWVSITGIVLDRDRQNLEFQVGIVSEKLPVAQFQDIPVCKSKLAYDSI